MLFLNLATNNINILAIARAFVSNKGEGGDREWAYVLPSESPWPHSGNIKDDALGGTGRQETMQGKRKEQVTRQYKSHTFASRTSGGKNEPHKWA